MPNLKDQLIKLGNNHPELREDISPVLHSLRRPKEAKKPDSLRDLHNQFRERLVKAAVESLQKKFPDKEVGTLGNSYMWVGDWKLDFQVTPKGVNVEVINPQDNVVSEEPFGVGQRVQDIMIALSGILARKI